MRERKWGLIQPLHLCGCWLLLFFVPVDIIAQVSLASKVPIEVVKTVIIKYCIASVYNNAVLLTKWVSYAIVPPYPYGMDAVAMCEK